MRVIIAGGSMAGLFAAALLRKSGHEVQVYERSRKRLSDAMVHLVRHAGPQVVGGSRFLLGQISCHGHVHPPNLAALITATERNRLPAAIIRRFGCAKAGSADHELKPAYDGGAVAVQLLSMPAE